MNPEQIPELIARIALADKRVRVEDPVEQTAQIDMWAGILADVPYDYAIRAAQAHYAVKAWPILPADIATRWAATVRDRMDRHTGTLEPTRYPELDPDDIEGFQQTLRAERRAVITGQTEPTPLKAITGAVPADVQARLDAVGEYVPAAAREQLAQFWPQQRTLGVLAHRCPQCGARPGQHCTTAKTRTNRATPHGARSHPNAA
ncbi:zinc finger domain-containing protein [Streptomyces sp. NBC_01233]|uniref:zinc finger domain-containing protein n=1 Tax=Streptomyces sp. NBC_01233 TaxID=2903787 RepID=UPI002E0D82B7|nr:hypothetical protein OG332_10575 [Streptomyces sp. NBC_01233]